MEPAAKVTKYLVLLDRLLVGSMVSVDPEMVSRVLVAASKVSTMVPVAEPERIKILPAPRWIASLKVNTMLLPTATPVAASRGMNVETVGAASSNSDARNS